MSWDHAQYVDFVNRHAAAAVRSSLRQATSKPYVSKDAPRGAKSSKIFLTYYSMPDWLDIFSLEAHLARRPFDHMVAEYRHVAQKHQDKVAACLDRIGSFPTGKALLKELGGTGHSVRIMPYWHYFRTMPGADYFNATPRPVKLGESLAYISDGLFSDSVDAYEKRAPVRDDDNQPFGNEIGTGRGADVALFFSAETWESKAGPTGPGFQPDEVLFHELVHVTRMLRGRMTHVAVEGRGGYGNIEEYFATVITNVYLSDKGQTMLRGLYSNELIRENRKYVKIGDNTVMVVIDPLPKNWSVMKDPANFYNNADKLTLSPRQLMQIFKDKQRDFYWSLSQLPKARPKFNPVAQHFRENQRLDI